MSSQEFFRGGKSSDSADSTRRQATRGKRSAFRSLQLETLESRRMMSGAPIEVHFDIPPDVAARGVYAEVSGVLTAPYQTNAGAILPTGSIVYYNPQINDYSIAQPDGKFVFQLSGSGAIIDLPNTDIKGAQIVIGVGGPPVVTYTAAGLATPTANTNPDEFFGLFEFAITSGGLDIDLSEIDQVGFPFVITTDPTAPSPAEDGVGIPITRSDLFNLFSPYIESQGPGAAPFMQSLTAGNGYRILAPQNVIDGDQAPISSGAPVYSTNGALTIGDTYYYWITATSVSGANRQPGETAASNVTKAVPFNDSVGGQNTPMATVSLNWNSFAGATGYNIYRSLTNNPATGQLVGSTTATTFTDAGLPLGSKTPPTNSYTFNSLNSYFNGALDSFFSHYTATNSFALTRDGKDFVGQTETDYQIGGTGPVYTVLLLHNVANPAEQYVIYKPYFSSNTNIAGAPPPPSWMPHPNQSPGAMILANDGVFNDGGAQPGEDAGTLSDLENSIVSAFNRGIADNFSIAPNQWSTATGSFYAPGSTSNWYAAFLHQNHSVNPMTGVSINGLAYGFAYDDDGAQSTNFQGFFSNVFIDLEPWGPNPTPTPGVNPNSVIVAANVLILLTPTGGDTNGLTPGVSTLGVNALPATDIPNDLPDGSVLATALPWLATENRVPGIIQAPGTILFGLPSLETGPLGNFAQLWRGGYGAIPEAIPAPADDANPEQPKSTSTRNLEEILDAIVQGSRAAAR